MIFPLMGADGDLVALPVFKTEVAAKSRRVGSIPTRSRHRTALFGLAAACIWTMAPGCSQPEPMPVGSQPREAEVLQAAKLREERGDWEGARQLYDLLAATGSDFSVVQEALAARGRVLLRMERMQEAFAAFREYLQKFPEGFAADEMKRMLFETARAMVVLENPSAEEGVSALRQAILSYPYEATAVSAPAYSLWLADYFFYRNEIEEARSEYLWIIDQYRDHSIVSGALFKLGECYLKTFRSVRFDSLPLKEAEKAYLRILDEFPRSPEAEAAAQRRAWIRERLAEKEFSAAVFYEERGYPSAARLYYRSIVEKYPEVSFAARAKEKIAKISGPGGEGPTGGGN